MFPLQRSLSIFNFEQIRVLTKLFNRGQVRFILCAGALLGIPLLLLDLVHLMIPVVVFLMVWVFSWWWLPTYRRHLYVLTLMIPLVGAAGEFAFRFRYFGFDGLSLDRYRPASYGNPWSTFEFSRETYTRLKPNQTVMFKGQPFTVNDRGFRGRNYAIPKPDGTFRVVVTGASVPLGSGVADDETMFAILERKLNTAFPDTEIEIVNMSRGGSSMGNMVHTLRHAGLEYEPDMIFFFMDHYAVEPRDFKELGPRTRVVNVSLWRKVVDPRFRFFMSRFFFFRVVRVHINMMGRTVISFLTPQKEDTPRPREVSERERTYLKEGLAALNAVADDQHVVLYLLRRQDATWRRELGVSFHETVKELAEHHGMRIVEVPPGLFGPYQESDLALYPGDQHPNAFAHSLQAEGLYPGFLAIMRELLGQPHEGE